MAGARLQRWAIILPAYQYEIKYRHTNQNLNADTLSRLPLKSVSQSVGEEAEVFQLSQFDELPVTAKQISDATSHDPILSTVLEFTLTGWPNAVQDESLKHSLYVEKNCLLSKGVSCWGGEW